MNIALRRPGMTRDEFFAWVATQEARFEFDGNRPVAMGGGSNNHSQITQNIYAALRARLRGGPCRQLGPDAGLATSGGAVRYPDALVTCTRPPGAELLVPGVVAVFEVLSPSSGRVDRIDKVREYRDVPSIRRYAILEYRSVGVTVFERAEGGHDWTATTLTGGETLQMGEVGIEIPVSDFYEDVDLSDA